MAAMGIKNPKRLADQYMRLAMAHVWLVPAVVVAHCQRGGSRSVLKAMGTNIRSGRGACGIKRVVGEKHIL
jgi:hypothetical protein